MSTFWLTCTRKRSYLSGSWKLTSAKPKVEGARTVGSISTQRVLYRGDSVVPLHHLPVFLAESDGWVQQKKNSLYQNMVFKCIVHSTTLVRPILRNISVHTVFWPHTHTQIIKWKQELEIQSLISKLCFLISRKD